MKARKSGSSSGVAADSSARKHAPERSLASRALDELIAAAAKKDRQAQNELLRRFWPLIRSAVRARKNRSAKALRQREQTQDLEQDVALKLLAELGKHRYRDPPSFGAWVKALAQHAVTDKKRYHAAQQRSPAQETAASRGDAVAAPRRSMESMIEGGRLSQRVLAELEALKPEHKSALLMHHVGFTHEEIGEALAVTAEAARKLVTRARLKLLAGREKKD